MESLQVKLGFEGMLVVEALGKSGRLALLWKEKELLGVQNYSQWHINAIVFRLDRKEPWKLTSFYNNLNWTKRKNWWALLNHLNSLGL
jgi:hypothetical protein